MSYHQFTSDERKCLWELHRKNLSIRKIADALGRAPSSVSRDMSQPQNNNFYQSESKKTDQYDEVKKQFDISDDDLPF